MSDAPPARRVLELQRDESAAAESLVSGDGVTAVTFDAVAADELLEQIFAADVVLVV